jgi:hypothetical protein
MKRTMYDKQIVDAYLDGTKEYYKALKDRNRIALLFYEIEQGNFYENACSLVGLNESTFYEWKNPKSKFYHSEFSEAIKKADTECEKYHIIKIHRSKHWQASAWWLERRKGNKYGVKIKQEHSGGIRLEKVTFYEPKNNSRNNQSAHQEQSVINPQS